MTTQYNIAAQIPDHVVSEYPIFVEFMRAYYEFMAQSGNPDDVIKNILDYRDVDTTIESFKTHILNEFMGNIPDNIVADKVLLAKHIKELYVSKGTESSYRMLFRILFNKEIDINYPSDQILKLSDGKWEQNISFVAHISNFFTPEEIYVAIGHRILVNIDSKQLPVSVLNIVQLQTTDPSNNLYEFFIKKDFYDDFNGATTFTCNTIGLIAIVNGGSGYTDADTVLISSIDGSGAAATLTTTQGAVSGVSLSSGGIGFVDAPIVQVISTTGTSAYLSPTLTQLFGGTILTSIYKPTVLQAPSGYIEGKVYPIIDSTGADAYLQIKRNVNGRVKNVTVAAFGKYYPDNLITVINRDNSVARATALISGGTHPPFQAWRATTAMPSNLIYGTATKLGSDRILLVGGTDGTAISAASYIGYVGDTTITWDEINPMLVPVVNHAAVMLVDGRILLAGGHNATTGEISTNTYFGTLAADATSIAWVAGSPLPIAMLYGTVTTLPDGRLLAVGGTDDATITANTYIGTVTGNVISWIPSNAMLVPVINHTASVLADGRILVAGGHNATTGEISTNTYIGTVTENIIAWVASTALPDELLYSTTSILDDGRIMLVGGTDGTTISPNTYIGTVSLNTIIWAASNTMLAPIMNHVSVVVSSSTVLSLGGNTNPDISTEISGQVYITSVMASDMLSDGHIIDVRVVSAGSGYAHPAHPAWRATTAIPSTMIYGSVSNLGEGRILLSGGTDGITISASQYMGYVSDSAIAWRTMSPLPVAMINHASVVLPDGRILLAGGHDATTGEISTNTYFGTVVGADTLIDWGAGTALPSAMLYGTVTILPNGRLLAIGGTDGVDILATSYLGTISANTITWTPSNAMPVPVINHTTSVLLDGRILVAGGHDATTGEISTNTYIGTIVGDVISWVASTALPAQLLYSTTSVLHDGRIMVAGGTDGTTIIADTHIGSVVGNTIAWSTGEALLAPMVNHSSVVLSSGSVLCLGGYTDPDVSPDISTLAYISGVFSLQLTVLGDGRDAKLFAVISNGSIVGVTIGSGGFGYTIPPAIVFSPTSLVVSLTHSKLRTYNGSYLSTDGFSSCDMMIYDGRYYQRYSYEIVISELFYVYRGVLKKLLHPAGYAVWGVYDIQKFLQVEITSEKVDVERSAAFRDIVYCVETIVKSMQKSVTDSASVTDIWKFTMAKSVLSESVTATDLWSYVVTKVFPTESVSTSDVVAKSIQRTITDAVVASQGDINTRYAATDYFAEDYVALRELRVTMAKVITADTVTPSDSFAWVLN
jgi:hypothetical protein